MRSGQAFERGPILIVAILFISILLLLAITIAQSPTESAEEGILARMEEAFSSASDAITGIGEGSDSGSAGGVPLRLLPADGAPPAL